MADTERFPGVPGAIPPILKILLILSKEQGLPSTGR
jgi:hypothetical protein